jgi:hypothetical protein
MFYLIFGYLLNQKCHQLSIFKFKISRNISLKDMTLLSLKKYFMDDVISIILNYALSNEELLNSIEMDEHAMWHSVIVQRLRSLFPTLEDINPETLAHLVLDNCDDHILIRLLLYGGANLNFIKDHWNKRSTNLMFLNGLPWESGGWCIIRR